MVKLRSKAQRDPPVWPWELSKADYRRWAARHHQNARIRRSARSRHALVQGAAPAMDLATVRHNEVLQALLRGEYIPASVLADYPDLQRQRAKK
jgi:hypothetical protein